MTRMSCQTLFVRLPRVRMRTGKRMTKLMIEVVVAAAAAVVVVVVVAMPFVEADVDA